jgi:hypothetical protein
MEATRHHDPEDHDLNLRGPFRKFVDSAYYSVYVFEKWMERSKK